MCHRRLFSECWSGTGAIAIGRSATFSNVGSGVMSGVPALTEATPTVPGPEQHLLEDLLPIYSGVRGHRGIRGSVLLLPRCVILLGGSAPTFVGVLGSLISFRLGVTTLVLGRLLPIRSDLTQIRSKGWGRGLAILGLQQGRPGDHSINGLFIVETFRFLEDVLIAGFCFDHMSCLLDIVQVSDC